MSSTKINLEQGNTALHAAVESMKLSEVQRLLSDPKIDCNFKNADGDTPLHIAARIQGSTGVRLLKALLEDPRVDINCSNDNNNTALHAAVRHDNLEGVKELLARGVDVNKQNKKGKTCLDIAINKGRDDIVECIKTAQSKEVPEQKPDGVVEVCAARPKKPQRLNLAGRIVKGTSDALDLASATVRDVTHSAMQNIEKSIEPGLDKVENKAQEFIKLKKEVVSTLKDSYEKMKLPSTSLQNELEKHWDAMEKTTEKKELADKLKNLHEFSKKTEKVFKNPLWKRVGKLIESSIAFVLNPKDKEVENKFNLAKAAVFENKKHKEAIGKFTGKVIEAQKSLSPRQTSIS